MSNTLDSTFSLFFSDDDEPTRRECDECGSTENLSVHYTTESGRTVFACAACKKANEEAQHQREEESARRIDSYP